MNDPQKALCAERILSLGYSNIIISRKQGPFASAIFHISAEKLGKRTQLIYKLPPPEREGEFDILFELGEVLRPWCPKPIHRFDDEPRAAVMEYAGEPILRSRPTIHPCEVKERVKRLEEVSDALAGLHLFTHERVREWGNAGILAPYAYSSEWAEALVRHMERLCANGIQLVFEHELEQLKGIVDSFYGKYSAESMRGPVTFTHGDPHWGNVLQRSGTLLFIDWEWCNAASPMRDISILLQEEPDDGVVGHIARRHAKVLIQGGCQSEAKDLLHDFERMMLDNTLMMAAWDIVLFDRGDISLEELRQMSQIKQSRIAEFWNRIST